MENFTKTTDGNFHSTFDFENFNFHHFERDKAKKICVRLYGNSAFLLSFFCAANFSFSLFHHSSVLLAGCHFHMIERTDGEEMKLSCRSREKAPLKQLKKKVKCEIVG